MNQPVINGKIAIIVIKACNNKHVNMQKTYGKTFYRVYKDYSQYEIKNLLTSNIHNSILYKNNTLNISYLKDIIEIYVTQGPDFSKIKTNFKKIVDEIYKEVCSEIEKQKIIERFC